jgi:PEP-CTERM motif
MRKIMAACAGTLLALASSPATAAIVARTFTFSATDFAYPVAATTPPYATVSGSFTIQFDDTLTYSGATAGITLDSLNLPIVPSALTFDYAPASPFLNVSNVRTTPFAIGPNPNFTLSIFGATTANPVMGMFSYTAPSFNIGPFVARTNRLSFTPAIAAVPEPTTWTMLITGFGLSGVLLRRRKSRRLATA